MKQYRKYMAKLLIMILAAGLISGCQKPSGGTGESSSGNSDQVQPRADRESETGESGALGRYRETEEEIPQEAENQSFISLIKGEDGCLELYTAERGPSGRVTEAIRYRCLDGKWEKEEEWAGDAVLKDRDLDVMNVVYGQDGNYYVGGTDDDYIYHLLKLEKDGRAEELLEDVFKPKEGESYGIVPPKIEILENGSILVYYYYEVYLHDPSGSRLLSLVKDFSGTTSDARGFCKDHEFVTINGDHIVVYDLRDGRVTETIDYSEIHDGRQDTHLFGDGAGGIFAVNEKGLSHINKGGTLWEVLMDGSLNHLGMRSLYLQQFLRGDQDDFYGAFAGEAGKGIRLFHYQYDPEMTAVPPTGLTVYSLEDNSTVRQAVAQFQSEHPDMRVELRTAVEEGGTVTEEMIRSLNTELLSGKGADVLILDGLPADSYIEKGVLTDLGSLVEEMEGSGDMLDNLLEGFREEDGTIYQIPARAGFPLLVGKPEAVQACFSLRTMAEYQGEKPLMGPGNYENLLRKVSRLCYEELFGKDMAVKERDVLIRYLETVKILGEAGGSQTVFSQAEMEEKNVSNYVTPDGLVRDIIDYDRGISDCGAEHLDGYSSLMMPAEVMRINPGSRMEPAGKLYLPSAIAGINRSTANEDTAKEFIRCLLSYEVQKEDFYDGFPVNKKALEAITESDSRDNYSESSGYRDGYRITARWAPLEVRREIASMLETLTVPVVVDETVMKMIAEGSKDYFDGEETVEQAADGILRKMSIYLAEQEE